MNIIIEKPLITEKTMKLAKVGLFTFIVSKFADKKMIAKEVARMFKVDVVAVKTANFKDEVKMQRGRRGYFIKPGLRKAVVILKKGQKIALFEVEKSGQEPAKEVKAVKEKKSLLKGTKVKIERGKESK